MKTITHHRKLPGETGLGKYYHVQVRPAESFIAFATQDVGKKGGLVRVAGKRSSGVWATAGWLIEKTMAHVSKNGRLIIDVPRVRSITKQIIMPILHKKGDIFVTRPRYQTPEDQRWGMIRQLSLAK